MLSKYLNEIAFYMRYDGKHVWLDFHLDKWTKPSLSNEHMIYSLFWMCVNGGGILEQGATS